MTNEQIKGLINILHPSAIYDETGEWMNVLIEVEEWRSIAEMLRKGRFHFDYLFCLTCIDWKTHFTMVYHLASTGLRHTLVAKIQLDRNNPQIESVSDIWRTAEFHEREVFDLFGVQFTNHPDLRRLILPDEWEGYPLRKDYEDSVNMIKL